MRTLRGALVGCGYFGKIQLDGWRRVSGARIEALCDLDSARLADCAAQFAGRPYDNLERLLDTERPDFLDVVTRPATHLPLVRLAASRGLPILCQKPMAETWPECLEIAAVARRSGLRLMMNENWRWQPWYRRLRELLDRGAIGRPVFYGFHARRRDGLGPAPYAHQPYFKDMPRLVIFEFLVHYLDTARFLFGPLEEVYCRFDRINPVIAGEDLAVILIRHASGLSGVIDGHRLADPDPDGPAMSDARFEGIDGVVSLRATGELFLGSERVFDPVGLPGYKGDSCRATQQHFIDCLLSGASFETGPDDYLRTVAAVEASYLSAAEHRPVLLEEILSPPGR